MRQATIQVATPVLIAHTFPLSAHLDGGLMKLPAKPRALPIPEHALLQLGRVALHPAVKHRAVYGLGVFSDHLFFRVERANGVFSVPARGPQSTRTQSVTTRTLDSPLCPACLHKMTLSEYRHASATIPLRGNVPPLRSRLRRCKSL